MTVIEEVIKRSAGVGPGPVKVRYNMGYQVHDNLRQQLKVIALSMYLRRPSCVNRSQSTVKILQFLERSWVPLSFCSLQATFDSILPKI